eukprot:CAMPEP_0201476220 /NCGR_PEP_ID=MMETSP0151_2-20130828/1471_1 /ASSEMBLY_ACC=CAM_ASM_000257 /TAXON_ID=200890 /ORGANISM="Paramoeba atlantica, Strain 621/1 / CCAP 1560/9" /LENGTH=787 /DNA_ID=CAMNT_0047856523 /DNA_START=1491 /DNA_END=3851 /DNA_ORIENTATION=-
MVFRCVVVVGVVALFLGVFFLQKDLEERKIPPQNDRQETKEVECRALLDLLEKGGSDVQDEEDLNRELISRAETFSKKCTPLPPSSTSEDYFRVALYAARDTDEAKFYLEKSVLLSPFDSRYRSEQIQFLLHFGFEEDAANALGNWIEQNIGEKITKTKPALLPPSSTLEAIDRACNEYPPTVWEASLELMLSLLDLDLAIGRYEEAFAIYRILTSVGRSNIFLHHQFSEFAQRVGNPLTSLQHAVQDLGGQMWNFLEQEEEEKTRVAIRERSELENAMKKMFLIEGVEVEMADWMWDRSLLLFGTILRSMQVSIARGLLMQKEEIPKMISKNCNIELSTISNQQTLSLSNLNKLIASCVSHQRAHSYLSLQRASLSFQNEFGWNALHQFACLGDAHNFDNLLNQFKKKEVAKEIDTTDQNGQTPLHTSIIMRSYDITKLVIKKDASLKKKDSFGRSAQDLFCRHYSELACQKVPDLCHCDSFVLPSSSPPLPFPNNNKKDQDSFKLVEKFIYPFQHKTPQIEVIDKKEGLTKEAFVADFLTTGVPVLVQNGLNSEMERERGKEFLESLSFDQLRGNDAAKELHVISSLPYGETFDAPHSSLSLSDFLDSLEKEKEGEGEREGEKEREEEEKREEEEERKEEEEEEFSAPKYLFSSLPQNSSLLSSFKVPPFLDFSHTNLTIRKRQFYVGDVGSGAPVHFHGAAFNVLAHGLKKWFLFPPSSALYSRVPALDWLQNTDLSKFEAGELYEVVQHPGDVLWLPYGWGHLTINIERSVGVAFEVHWGGLH